MNSILQSYLATALWSSIDHNDMPMDRHYSIDDFTYETIKQADKELTEFIEKADVLVDGYDLERVAHDFWLTRNRHGAGFWDGDYTEAVGKALTDLAHSFGEINLYVGDDGKIYFS